MEVAGLTKNYRRTTNDSSVIFCLFFKNTSHPIQILRLYSMKGQNMTGADKGGGITE